MIIMEITLTTPAILFPAVSLLLVAYTNRFNAVSMRIRSLHAQYKENPDVLLEGQIDSLRKRINIIKNMQRFGVLSLFLCVFCLVVLFGGNVFWGKVIFGLSLIFMMFSLGLALWEISLSVEALNIELSDMQR
jgi:hypothetical protein